MVIGSGMMARAFQHLSADPSVLIFASGVSNSKEKDPVAFVRERELLSSHSHTNATLVYFSTCSIYDQSLLGSNYIRHKLEMETFIQDKYSSYWIFRLPNVIGPSGNPHTMCNFFFDALKENRPFELDENAVRYFIDIDDVKETLGKIFLEHKLHSGIYNLLFPHVLPVKQLVNIFEDHLGKKANANRIQGKGAFYDVKLSDELLPFTSFIHEPSVDYFERVISKYYRRDNK